MTTEIREFYIKRVPVDVQERLTARDEAQVMLVMDSFAAHRTESDRAKIKALVSALNRMHDNLWRLLAGVPVSDVDETIAESNAALNLAGGE